MKPGLPISPSSMTSTPSSVCLRTMSPTARLTRAANASGSYGRPVALAWISSSRSAGRGRLPAWVVRIRSVLRFMLSSARRAYVFVVGLEWDVGERLPAPDLTAQRPGDRLHAEHDPVIVVVELLAERVREPGALVGVELSHRCLDVLVVLAVAQEIESSLRVQHAAPGQD